MIETYDALIDAVQDYLVGHLISDATAAIFISNAEAEFNRKLRTREMLCRAVATVDDQYVPLPSDFLEIKNVTLSTGETLRPITMDQADHQRAALLSGTPQFYCVTGAEIELVPSPTAEVTVEMVYYERLDALSADTPTNWLLSKAPDAYLLGALVQASHYIADVNRGGVWRSETERICAELNADADTAMFGASPLIIRARRNY